MNKYILLSIKPKIIKEIISGEKKFEFRKKLPDLNDESLGIAKKVIIYSSSPEKKIMGSFVIKNFHQEKFNDMMHVVNASQSYRERIYRYFKHEGVCFSMEISDFRVYEQPLTLTSLRLNHNNFGPGQSYRYLYESCSIISELKKLNGSL